MFPADSGEFNTPLPNPAESWGNLPVALREVCGEENSPGKNKSLRNLLSLAWYVVVDQSWVNEDLGKRLVWLKPKQTLSKNE